MGFFTGTKGKFKKVATLGEEQMPLYDQLQASLQGSGAGGAFGQIADYYRDLMSDDSQTFNAMIAPQMRRFNEEIIPGLSEQFAGMGSGGLSSSSFRNAAVNASTDLSERLGAIRAQLRQQGAAGLSGLASQGLQPYNENIYQPGTEGFIDYAAPLAGSIAGSFLGPAGTAAGGAIGNALKDWISNKGQTSPYGGALKGALGRAF